MAALSKFLGQVVWCCCPSSSKARPVQSAMFNDTQGYLPFSGLANVVVLSELPLHFLICPSGPQYHHQFYTCSVCPHHSDTHCCTNKDQCRTNHCSASTSGKRTVCFASTANQLNDDLWRWESIGNGSSWTFRLLVVVILQVIQLRPLQRNADLSPHSCLDRDSQDILSQSSRDRR